MRDVFSALHSQSIGLNIQEMQLLGLKASNDFRPKLIFGATVTSDRSAKLTEADWCGLTQWLRVHPWEKRLPITYECAWREAILNMIRDFSNLSTSNLGQIVYNKIVIYREDEQDKADLNECVKECGKPLEHQQNYALAAYSQFNDRL